MSNSLKLQILLTAVDQASRPLKAIKAANKALSDDIRTTQQYLDTLDAKMGKIDGFRKTSTQLSATSNAFKKAKKEAAELRAEIKNAEVPTRLQIKSLDNANQAVSRLETKYRALHKSAKEQRNTLRQNGINPQALPANKQRLKDTIEQTSNRLAQQRKSLAENNRQQNNLERIKQRQTQLGNIKQRYQSGKVLADNLGNLGNRGVGVAKTALSLGTSVLAPGYALSQENTKLQTILGLDKSSSGMQALRQQAKKLSGHSAGSAVEATTAQIVIANAGADKDGVLAATAPTLKMAQSNQHSVEDNAALLMGMESAFGLGNDQIAHISDVITAALSRNTIGFDNLNKTLNYTASAASSAGVSIEETAAMASALADANITGSAAATGNHDVIRRLQSPTDNAREIFSKLGVKTTDNQGNMRPIFSILEEIQRSFASNKLGAAQREAYTKAIFGNNASTAASVLMHDASSGKLAGISTALQKSDGKTDSAATASQNNLSGDIRTFQAAYEAIGIDLFEQQEGSLRTLVQTASRYVNKVEQWIQNNQALSQTIIAVVSAGSALIGLLGGVGIIASQVVAGINLVVAGAGLLWTTFSAAGGAILAILGTLTWPIVAIAAAIVAGALLIRQYWEPIGAFFSGVIEGLQTVFAPMAEMFMPWKAQFDLASEGLQKLWGWFTDLISPVESSQEAINNCKNAGILFGEAISLALTLPLKAFNFLGEKVDWLLEKLGIIKSQSADIDANAINSGQKANVQAISPTGGILNANYAPLATGNSSYRDQSQHNFQIDIHVPPGQGPEATKKMFSDWVESYERQRYANSLSHM